MKRNIEHISIWNFEGQNKLKAKDMRLLLEAYRRKHFLNAEECFLGLGMPSHYKSKFFTASFKETPKVNNWYKLTKEGEDMLNKMESFFTIPKEPQEADKINELLFTF